jgi:hypothetical protein
MNVFFAFEILMNFLSSLPFVRLSVNLTFAAGDAAEPFPKFKLQGILVF